MNNQLTTIDRDLPAWWNNKSQVSLIRRTAFAACNDTEFDEAVSVARELRLNPLRNQIYAFVFSADKPDKRNMVLVVGIDGGRSIAARHKNYRPDNKAPRYTIDDKAVDELSNPLGLVSAEVSCFLHSHGEWHEIVAVAYWDEFAPIIQGGEDGDYKWEQVPGEFKPDGKPRYKKVLKEGVVSKPRLDPKKEGWRKSARHMLAKCAEMIALRKGWPEDLSRVYVEEETHRSSAIIDAEFTVTPTEMAQQADMERRQALIGGPALLAINEHGDMERVPHGKFFDWFISKIEKMTALQVADFAGRNNLALNEFWTAHKPDALELKKRIEARSSRLDPEAKPVVVAQTAVPAATTTGRPRDFIAEIKAITTGPELAKWGKDNLDAIDASGERSHFIWSAYYEHREKIDPGKQDDDEAR